MSITPYTFDLEPGQTQHETFGEANYIFVDFADRTIEVMINGSVQPLRKGSRYRSRTGMFSKFDITNPDPDRPCRVLMFIGTDEIDNQIIEGEIMIEPGLRKADGTFATDTRFDVSIGLEPLKLTSDSYLTGDLIAQSILPDDSADLALEIGGSIFLGPNDDLYTPAYDNSDGAFFSFLQRFDRKTLVLLERLDLDMAKVRGKNGVSATWMAGVGYLVVDPQTRNVLIANSNNSSNFPTFAQVPATWTSAERLAVDSKRERLIVYGNRDGNTTDSVAIFDKNGVLLLDAASEFSGVYENVTYDQANDVLALQNSETWYEGDPTTGLQTTAARTVPNSFNQSGACLIGDVLVQGTLNTLRIRKRAFRDFSTKAEFRAVKSGCLLPQGLLKREAGIQTTAAITVTDLGSTLSITGELVKAALEYHFGLPVADDYLDHVYALYRTSDEDQRTAKPVYTGNQTFDRANVPDDFGISLPGSLTLTIDNELSFLNPLLVD